MKNDDVYEYSISELKKENTRKNQEENKTLEERYQDNFDEERKNLRRNIKRLTAFTVALFMAVTSYLIYFQVVKAPSVKTDPANRRMAEERNSVLRGSILDRNGNVLSESTLNDDGTQTRTYTGGEAFGNILGYVSDKYSVTGLEESLDSELSKNTQITDIFSPQFLKGLLNPSQSRTSDKKGNTVRTTLDSDLQKTAYEALGGRKGSVVALDPNTGEILAMVSSPGFDSNDLDAVMEKVNTDSEYAKDAPLINRAINGKYAPGSTFKIVTLASALDNIPGVRDRIFDDTGVIEFQDGTKINNFLNYANGEISLLQGFMWSSNFVFGTLGVELTNKELLTTAEAFGLNKNIDSQGLNVSKSVFPSMNDEFKGNKALSAIGQGEVSVTPLQMAMISAGIANNGVIMTPQIIEGITDKDNNTVKSFQSSVFSKALSEDTAATVREFMRSNVTETNTYRTFRSIDGAGKTGTAQFEKDGTTKVNAWFTGFAPYDNPKIAVAVILEDMDDVVENTGAAQAIPVAKAVMQYYLENGR